MLAVTNSPTVHCAILSLLLGTDASALEISCKTVYRFTLSHHSCRRVEPRSLVMRFVATCTVCGKSQTAPCVECALLPPEPFGWLACDQCIGFARMYRCRALLDGIPVLPRYPSPPKADVQLALTQRLAFHQGQKVVDALVDPDSSIFAAGITLSSSNEHQNFWKIVVPVVVSAENGRLRRTVVTLQNLIHHNPALFGANWHEGPFETRVCTLDAPPQRKSAWERSVVVAYSEVLGVRQLWAIRSPRLPLAAKWVIASFLRHTD